MIYTTEDAAGELGCAIRTVRKLAQTLGIRKRGRDYLLDIMDLERIKGILHPGPGRPRKRRAPG